MSTADYLNALNVARAKHFVLDRQTGEKKSPTDAIMRQVMKTKEVEDTRSEFEKRNDRLYEMQRDMQDISEDSITEYEVRPGDTISSVLERTGMSFGEFLALNADSSIMSSEGELYAGNTISVVNKPRETEV